MNVWFSCRSPRACAQYCRIPVFRADDRNVSYVIRLALAEFRERHEAKNRRKIAAE
jgi:hypothetical protein